MSLLFPLLFPLLQINRSRRDGAVVDWLQSVDSIVWYRTYGMYRTRTLVYLHTLHTLRYVWYGATRSYDTIHTIHTIPYIHKVGMYIRVRMYICRYDRGSISYLLFLVPFLLLASCASCKFANYLVSRLDLYHLPETT